MGQNGVAVTTDRLHQLRPDGGIKMVFRSEKAI